MYKCNKQNTNKTKHQQTRLNKHRVYKMQNRKTNQSFFHTLDTPVPVKACECSGCTGVGEYKAPKSPEHLSEYYWFCLNHVREYNAAWDFFAGQSEQEIEDSIRKATVWERPTWPLGNWKKREQNLHDTLNREFFGGSGNAHGPETAHGPLSAGERDALAILNLEAPVTFEGIKAQYRILVKKWHPDANGGSPESEEKFKIINHAYATLRAIHEGDSTT